MAWREAFQGLENKIAVAKTCIDFETISAESSQIIKEKSHQSYTKRTERERKKGEESWEIKIITLKIYWVAENSWEIIWRDNSKDKSWNIGFK